jgi:transcriptional regulator GlxA family with amidase domain
MLKNDVYLKIEGLIRDRPNIRKHSVSALANRFKIGRRTLEELFKKKKGLSLGKFIQTEALRRAKELIISTNRPIDEISEEIGYLYRANFDKAFRKEFNCSGSELRVRKYS